MKESCSFEIARLKKKKGKKKKKKKKKKKEKKERKAFWPSGDFLVRYFAMLFHITGCVVSRKTLEDEQYVLIKAYKFTIFEILRDTFVLS